METQGSWPREKKGQGQPPSSVPEAGLPLSFPDQGPTSLLADGSGNETLAWRRDP